MQGVSGTMAHWMLADLRRRMYRAPTPRERERWHVPYGLLVQGWTAVAVARGAGTGMPIPLAGGLHVIRVRAVRAAMAFEQSGGSPRDRTEISSKPN